MIVRSAIRLAVGPMAVAIALAGFPAAAQQEGAGKATPIFDERAAGEIRDIVRQYLLDHPEVIVEAIQTLQARQRDSGERQQRAAIAEATAELQQQARDPSIGNPDAPLVIVEFFDYACSYCKSMVDVMVNLVQSNKDVRLVLKEFPILNPDSTTAARTALALARQGADKYRAFHVALMHAKALNGTIIERAAREAGADMSRLKRDLALPEIDETIEANHALARRLGISGTPAIIVGDKLVPGAIGADALSEMVAELREKRAAR